MVDLIDKISTLIKDNVAFCLVTVVVTRGATPRKAGAKMVVLDHGAAYGSVGGGSIENFAIGHARDVMNSKKPDLKVYKLDKLENQMSCGGSMTLFFEPYFPQRRLTIFGGGHVGRALSHAARVAGWKVVVVDHRAEVLDKAYFPNDTELISQPYSSYIETHSFSEHDWIVIVTPLHQYDQEVLHLLISKELAYLGMMGSDTKVNEIRTNLIKLGLKSEDFHHVHAPIGLNIGRETPGEIAISIVAEMQAVLHNIDVIAKCMMLKND